MKRKKENFSDNSLSSGITITDSISLTFNSRYRINSRLLLIITALAGVAGFTLSFLSLFSFECDRQMIFTAEAMMFIVSSVFCLFPAKAKLLHVPVYLAAGYIIYRIRIEFSYGYAQFVNVISEKLKITPPGEPYYRIPETADTERCLTLFMMFLFMILITVICFNTIVKPRFVTVFSCTFPFIETGLMFGFSPDHTAFALLISYWIAVFAMRVAGNQYHSTSGKPVFVRKNNIFVSSGNLRNNVIEDIGIITLVSVFSVFVLSGFIVDRFNIQRPEKVTRTRYELKTAVSDLSIEKIANRVYEDTDLNPVTEKSQLGNISKINYLDKTDLSIFVSDRPQNILYLKGFVGSEYRNNTWFAVSEQTVNNNKALFDSFRSTGIYPQFFNYYNDYALSQLYPSKISKAHVIVNSWFKNNSYAFTTYSTSGAENLSPENDTFFRTNNLNSYSYDMFLTPDYFRSSYMITQNTDRLSSTVTETEKKYRDYVYENYLLLPESEEMNMLAAEYGYIPDYDGKNIDDIYKAIREILSDSAEYSLEPGKTPADTELTWHFLKENHKGYCSHFATAGVVLARLNGVPARYCEGYVAIPSDFLKAEYVNSFYKLDIKDSRAHAWAEFYIDGYGWLPFEFTPGYDRGIISAEKAANELNGVTEVTEMPVTEAPVVVTEIVEVTEIVTAPAETQMYGGGNVTENASDGDADSGNDGSGSSGSEDGNGSSGIIRKGLSKALRLILTAVLIVCASAVMLLLIHSAAVKNRAAGFRCKSNNESISNLWKYVTVLLEHISIKQGSMLPLEFAEYADSMVGSKLENSKIPEDALSDVVKSVLKAGYSGTQIDNEELASAVKTANLLADSIYRSKNKRDGFIFRYILNLCR